MTGLPEHNYPAFDAAAIKLQNRGFNVLNPVSIDSDLRGSPRPTWDWYMRHAIRMILSADAVALLPDWQDSRGAALEVQIAKALTLDVRTLEAWLSS